MKELFQINDYIRIASACYEKEFRDKRIHFEMPSRDVQFWYQHRDSHQADVFRRLLSGETLTVESNRLTVEFPKELAGNVEEIEKMVAAVFGHEGVEHGVLPVPECFIRSYHLNVQVIPDTACYTISGRCVTVLFTTKVCYEQCCSCLSQRELEQGILCNYLANENTFRIIREVILNPDGIEFIITHSTLGAGVRYLISNSTEEHVLRRKFKLMYDHCFGVSESKLLDMIGDFKEKHRTYHYSRSPYIYQPSMNRSGYRIDDFMDSESSVQDCVEYYTALENTLEEYISLMTSCQGVEYEEFEKEIPYGLVTLFIDGRDVGSPNFQNMKGELQSRINNYRRILQFLLEDLRLDSKSRRPLRDFLMDVSFRKVLLDPISYTDDDGVFRAFALSLV